MSQHCHEVCDRQAGSSHASASVLASTRQARHNQSPILAIDAETGLAVDVAPGTSLLEALEEAAQEIVAVGCRNGGCGVCRVRILSGTFEKGKMSRRFVSIDQEKARVALACRVYPTSALIYRREPLEHRAERWAPVFREKRCDNKELEQAACVRFNAACSELTNPPALIHA